MRCRLPQSPNLEYLAKEAKRHLRGLRHRDPAARLSHAQRAVARRYGFASWIALRAHVRRRHVAVPDVPAPTRAAASVAWHAPVGRRMTYTERVRQALVVARWAVERFGGVTIEPSHILLGLMHPARDAAAVDERDAPGRLFARAGVSLDAVRADLERRILDGAAARLAAARDAQADPSWTSAPGSVSAAALAERFSQKLLPRDVALSAASSRLLVHAGREAHALGHTAVGAQHVLLGIFRLEESVDAAALRGHGMRLRTLRRHVARLSARGRSRVIGLDAVPADRRST